MPSRNRPTASRIRFTMIGNIIGSEIVLSTLLTDVLRYTRRTSAASLLQRQRQSRINTIRRSRALNAWTLQVSRELLRLICTWTCLPTAHRMQQRQRLQSVSHYPLELSGIKIGIVSGTKEAQQALRRLVSYQYFNLMLGRIEENKHWQGNRWQDTRNNTR